MKTYRFDGGFSVQIDEPTLLKALENTLQYQAFLRKLSNTLAREVRRFVPVDTGKLRDSILPLDPQQDVGTIYDQGQRIKPKYVAGISIGASNPKNKRADLAPYWAFVEYGTGLRGLFTEIKKPVGNPVNWKYGIINGQRASGYIRKGLASLIQKSKKGVI